MKTGRKIEKFNLTLAGVKHYVDRPSRERFSRIAKNEDGITCRLVLEPENEIDNKAIKVIAFDAEKRRFDNIHIGYIARPSNAPLFTLLSRGARVKSCVLKTLDADEGVGDLRLWVVLAP